MKQHYLVLLAALAGMLITGASAQISTSVAYHYTAINYPGVAPQETGVNGINNGNAIVGSYPDPNTGASHGFEYVNGKFSTFDYPGAYATVAQGIADNGDVVGEYQLDFNGAFHGFLRHNGSFMTIDYPGASQTMLMGINKTGTIVGDYGDNNGFIYQNGTFKPYSAPTRDGEPNYFSTLNAINNLGSFVGEEQSGDYQAGFWTVGNDVDFLEPVSYFRNNTVSGINGRNDVVGCLNGAAYIAFAVESGEGGEGAEHFPSLEMLSSPLARTFCPTGINYARVIVGNPGFVAIPVLTLNVTTPPNNATVTNPVHVAANASGVNSISQIQIWVNYKEIYHANGATLNANITLPSGKNERFVVQVIDSKGITTKVANSLSVN